MSLSRPNRKRRVAAQLGLCLALASAGALLHPSPAAAWWRNGVWWGPAYRPPVYVVPPPVYVAPPIYAAPPPVYVAPPPVYAAPPPYAPPGALARSCYARPLVCPMEVPRPLGVRCYCTDGNGYRYWGQTG